MQRLLSDIERDFEKFNAREIALTSKVLSHLNPLHSVLDLKTSIPSGVAHSQDRESPGGQIL